MFVNKKSGFYPNENFVALIKLYRDPSKKHLQQAILNKISNEAAYYMYTVVFKILRFCKEKDRNVEHFWADAFFALKRAVELYDTSVDSYFLLYLKNWIFAKVLRSITVDTMFATANTAYIRDKRTNKDIPKVHVIFANTYATGEEDEYINFENILTMGTPDYTQEIVKEELLAEVTRIITIDCKKRKFSKEYTFEFINYFSNVLDGNKECLREIGERLGISHERVRHILQGQKETLKFCLERM